MGAEPMSTIARGLIVWGILVAWASPGSAQSGYVYHYAFAMLIGVVLFITAYLYVQVG